MSKIKEMREIRENCKAKEKYGDMETPQHGNWFKISGNRANYLFFLMHFRDFFEFYVNPSKSDFEEFPLFFDRFNEILDPFPLKT